MNYQVLKIVDKITTPGNTGNTVNFPNIRTPKFPNYSDTQKISCNHSKIWTMWLYHRVMSPNDAHGMANSVDPDQIAPQVADWSGSALFALAYLSENLGSLRYQILKIVDKIITPGNTGNSLGEISVKHPYVITSLITPTNHSHAQPRSIAKIHWEECLVEHEESKMHNFSRI